MPPELQCGGGQSAVVTIKEIAKAVGVSSGTVSRVLNYDQTLSVSEAKRQAMMRRLREGRSVGVFPEGGTRGGGDVGPFHARIFLAAVEAGVPVQPVALRYGDRGAAQTVVAFGPRENFLSNFARLLGEPPRRAEVHFLAPIAPGDAEGRRRIAELARARIVDAMAR